MISTNPIVGVPCNTLQQAAMLSTTPIAQPTSVAQTAYETSPVTTTSQTTSSVNSTPPEPAVTIVANPQTVSAGTRSTISWASVDTFECAVGTPGQPLLGTSTSGAAPSGKLSTTTEFIVACQALASSTIIAATTTVTTF